ncbi:MAG: hypothetical protein ACQERD_12315, partial [Campylobacterota bacterium]
QIQSIEGEPIFFDNGEIAYSSMDQLDVGYGYWVKGSKGSTFTSYSGLNIPSTHQYETKTVLNEDNTVTVGNYKVKAFAQNEVTIDTDSTSTTAKNIIFNIDGSDNKNIAMHPDYTNNSIILAVYDTDEKLVYVSSEITNFDNSSNSLEINLNSQDSTTNTPPILSSIEDWDLDLGSHMDITLPTSDTDGDSVTLSAVSSDTSVVSTSISGDILTITGNATGTATITVTPNDGTVDGTSQTFTVTVNDNNGSGTDTSALQSALSGNEIYVSDSYGTYLGKFNSDGTYEEYSKDDGQASETMKGTWEVIDTYAVELNINGTSDVEKLVFSSTNITDTTTVDIYINGSHDGTTTITEFGTIGTTTGSTDDTGGDTATSAITPPYPNDDGSLDNSSIPLPPQVPGIQ